jgi:signal transduction histidine kinase
LAQAHRQQGDLEAALGYYEQLHSTQQEHANDEMARKLANLRVIHETETAQQEAVIHRLKTVELEKEISQREEAEAQLRRYATELEARNAELDAFAHTVAHGLKGPLTAVMGAGSVLQQFASMPDERRRQLLQAILEGGRWMKGIVDALLLLASVRGAEEVDMSNLDMVPMVKGIRERLSLLIEERRAEITAPETLPAAVGYGPWAEEVWANYLSNAIKYGGSPPKVLLGGAVQEDGFVRFWVQDNGLGLTPEQQERLFVPFERMHSERTEGHGLGLSIVRRIVEKLGGKIGVVSKLGKGSTFYFTLKAADESKGEK